MYKTNKSDLELIYSKFQIKIILYLATIFINQHDNMN